MLAFLPACTLLADANQPGEPAAESSMPDRNIEQLITLNADRIMALADVVAVAEGQCDGHACIKVLLAKENADTRSRLPSELQGIPVMVEISGPFVTGAPQ